MLISLIHDREHDMWHSEFHITDLHSAGNTPTEAVINVLSIAIDNQCPQLKHIMQGVQQILAESDLSNSTLGDLYDIGIYVDYIDNKDTTL